MVNKLEKDEINQKIKSMTPWQIGREGRAIERTYVFENFSDAFSFMTAVAFYAEKIDHHPEWFNVYNRVEVTLTTHDCKGVSDKDFDLAHVMDATAVRFDVKK